MVRALVLFLVLAASGCTYVEPGYVGIKVNSYGSQKGVEDFPLQTGRVTYNPWTETVYQYPTFMQSRAWTEDNDEQVKFNSKEGAEIQADVAINYTLEASKVPAMFVEFRQDIDVVTDTYLRTQVRDGFNRVGGNFKAVDIFGEKKQEVLDQVKSDLRKRLAPKGFLIDNVSFIGSPRADDRVMNSINSVIEATQKAIEAENKVREVEAQAKQEVAKANGAAQATLARASAEAEANLTVAKSITKELIQYELLKKWDGVAPKVMGSDTGLLLNMDPNK